MWFLLKDLCIRFEIISNLLIGGKNLVFATGETERQSKRAREGEVYSWASGIKDFGYQSQFSHF